MSIILEGAILPPHHLQDKSASSWPSPYHPQYYPALASSPGTMSPQSFHSYNPRLPESPLPSQELNCQPTTGWYAPSISAPECHSETTYASYGYIPPHTAQVNLSPPASASYYSATAPVSTTHSTTAISPGTVYSRESVVPESTRPSEEPQSDARTVLHQPTSRYRRQSHFMDRTHSGSDSLHSAAVDGSWTMNALGIHANHEAYYPAFPTHSPRVSEPSTELSSSHMPSPQPRRMYTPIAPLPLETPRSHGTKRQREDDEEEEPKRRKRSDSQISSQFELSEEDRLLLRLKEEEHMPWKDIAARFVKDFGRQYQIPALQMRIKRLKERMRQWTEVDVQALRKAHDYWVQNKFDIIAQKMLDYGAEEKWTARQCSRKWQEIDPTPIPYTQFDHHVQHVQQGFAPYAMSPIEPTPMNFPPFLHQHHTT